MAAGSHMLEAFEGIKEAILLLSNTISAHGIGGEGLREQVGSLVAIAEHVGAAAAAFRRVEQAIVLLNSTISAHGIESAAGVREQVSSILATAEHVAAAAVVIAQTRGQGNAAGAPVSAAGGASTDELTVAAVPEALQRIRIPAWTGATGLRCGDAAVVLSPSVSLSRCCCHALPASSCAIE